MVQAIEYVAWVYTGEGMAVQVGDLKVTIPDGLAEHLLDDDYIIPGDSPERDLIEFEAELRRTAFHASRRVQRTKGAVARQREMIAYLDTELGLGSGEHERRLIEHARGHAVDLLATLQEEHTVATDSLEHWQLHIAQVRDFVGALGVEHGPLAAAAAGWRRSPDRPEYVREFASEEAFVAADPRRAAETQRITLLDAEDFGRGWRRDPDDDDDPLGGDPELVGPWEVGYLPATGEIYGLRRGWAHRSVQVWLLGGPMAPDAARRLLARAERHRLEPNSLLLVAQMTHQALREASGETPTTPRPVRRSPAA